MTNQEQDKILLEQEQTQKNREELIRLENVNLTFSKKTSFIEKGKTVHVLKDINLTLYKGEIVAVVGESGCGKTSLGRLITGITKATSGKIFFEGRQTSGIFDKDIRSFRKVQFIQQDSYAALNPVNTIYQSLYAPIKTRNRKWSKHQINSRINELMELIGLLPAEQYLSKYPHQLSGGQRQRILMARAISLDPELIVADEPVSMIDVSLRLALLNLMSSLNKKLNISFLYITHDLSTARFIAQNGRMVVMYLGEIVEEGELQKVLSHPIHPYTKALIRAVPSPNPMANNDDPLPLKSFELTNIENRPKGCAFSPRCLYATEGCSEEVPSIMVNGIIVKCCNVEKKDD